MGFARGLVQGSSLSRNFLSIPKCPAKSKATSISRCRRQQKLKRDGKSIITQASEVGEIASIFPGFRSIIDGAFAVGIFGSLAWSALPVIASSTDARKANWQEKVWAKQEEEGIKWGVMSVISFLPVFNWLAWVFGALQNDERAAFYYILAILYAEPQLNAGFEPNLLSVLTLAAGIAHIQVERIAEERDIYRDTPQVSDELKAKPGQAGKLLGDTAKGFAEAVDMREQNQDIKEEVLRGKPSKRQQRTNEDDLRTWDQRLKDRK